ncbi:MAG: leucyl aminopeptidase [Fusobacteriaceae bacterium]|jgi:leucyl aminopeptidase|nr:leucyl aminopeptidase [Fusobacteriaceae bacterium]
MGFSVIKKTSKNYDYIVLLVEEDKIKDEDIKFFKNLTIENKKFIEHLIKKEKFTGKKNEILSAKYCDENIIYSIIFVGVGKKKFLSYDSLKNSIYSVIKNLKGNVLIESTDSSFIDIDMLGILVENANYNFNKYKSIDKNNKKETKKENKKLNLEYLNTKFNSETIEGVELGKITNIVRDLVNEPANFMTPEILAENALILGKDYGFQVEIHDESEIEKLNMTAFLSVGRASVNRPRLIVMKYTGNNSSKNAIGLVGKGLCYDAGGLSIKSTGNMLTMKSDMTGAATVIGVMCALAKMNINKNVVSVIAACENVIGGNAYKPGDIIYTMAGKSVEITNTDAEGRLTLADAITYTLKNNKISEIIDIATLTGAVIVALGESITGVFTNTYSNFEKLKNAGDKWGEKYWNMPMDDEFKDMIKSCIADIKNSAGSFGGPSTGAKFLEEFIENKPWMHLDIAGTSFRDVDGKYYKKGATGEVLKTLYTYIKGE